MQLENTNSCIISGSLPSETETLQRSGRLFAAEEPKNPPLRKIAAKKIRPAFGFLRRLMYDFKSVERVGRKKLLCTAAGAGAAALGFAALGSYCTLGINYYCGGKLLCTVAASDDAAAIIGAAARKADKLGADEPEIETSAKLALRSSLVDGEKAIEAILAASPTLCRGYIASVDGIDLFVTDSRKAVDDALADYVAKYSLNSEAALSDSIDVRSQIVRRDEVTPTDYITTLLEEGGVLSVMNTVDLTEQQTLVRETKEIADDNLYVGETVVENEGSDGTLVTVNEQVYSNGELLSTAVISEKTTLAPVAKVVRVGTKPRNALVDGLSYPVSGRFTSGFGERWGRRHRGIDLAVELNTPVAAAAGGTVITAEYKESYGNLVQIDHGYGIVTSYAHLNTIAVSVGQTVSRGDIVAYSGNTGNSTGPHLHFEVINNGEYLNPLEYMK